MKMSRFALQSALALSLAFEAFAQAQTPSPSTTDPCKEVASPHLLVCDSAFTCTKEARVAALCEMRNAFDRHYVGMPLKGALVKAAFGEDFDPQTHLTNCIRAETQIQGPDGPLSQIEFLDRVRSCLAAFHDEHLENVSARSPLPAILTGFSLIEVAGGKFVIGQVNRKILGYLELAGQDLKDVIKDWIKPGNEIISFDGKSIEEWIKVYSKFSMGSNPSSQRQKSLNSITARNFSFPRSAVFTVTLKQSSNKKNAEPESAVKSFQLPWWSSKRQANRRSDITNYFKSLGIQSIADLTQRYDPKKGQWVEDADDIIGFNPEHSALPARFRAQTDEYFDAEGDVALRHAIVVHQGKGLGYLQILTFDSDTLKLKGSEKRESTLHVINDFIRDCREAQVPLILDLRANAGGISSLARHSFALMNGAAEKVKAFSVEAFRPSAATEELIRAKLTAYEMNSRAFDQYGDWSVDPLKALELLEKARAAKQGVTDLAVILPKEPHEFLKDDDHDDVSWEPYPGEIVVLTSPLCVSACETFVGLMKTSLRAKVIGDTTAGTGFGFISQGDQNSKFQDSIGIFSVTIPNRMFGFVASDEAKSDLVLTFASHGGKAINENLGVKPDVPYKLEASEAAGKHDGWFEKALSILFPAPSSK